MSGPTPHRYVPTVIDGTPALRCVNTGCQLVWWPDRFEPKHPCPYRRERRSS